SARPNRTSGRATASAARRCPPSRPPPADPGRRPFTTSRVMRIPPVFELPADAAAATAVQDALRSLVRATDPRPPVFGTVAGLDSAYDDDTGLAASAAVVLDAHTLTPIETAVAHGEVRFPYVPGLLAFRELPTTLAALRQLTTTPDLLVCDAQGLAHPRRFGLACHVGV